MGRAPCCDKTKVKRGPWSPEEDNILKTYLEKNGTGGNWISLPQKAGFLYIFFLPSPPFNVRKSLIFKEIRQKYY